MGLWDKVKSVANKITGGGAKVTLTVEGTELKGTIKVHISAEIKDAPINVTKVYLYVRSVERVNIPKNAMPSNSGAAAETGVTLDKEVYPQTEFVVAGVQTLEGGKTYNWSYDLNLAGTTVPAYHGVYAHHEWQFFAGLDAPGNDPDSGWQTVSLY